MSPSLFLLLAALLFGLVQHASSQCSNTAFICSRSAPYTYEQESACFSFNYIGTTPNITCSTGYNLITSGTGTSKRCFCNVLNCATYKIFSGITADCTSCTKCASGYYQKVISSTNKPCILDTGPPVFTNCPTANPALTANNTPGLGTGVVSALTLNATDDSEITPSISCTPSGTTFNVGTTSVTCTATDSVSKTSTCTYNVAVYDVEFPSVTCPNVPNTPMDANSNQATVSFTLTRSDNVGVASWGCSPASGSKFNGGSTSVTCYAADAAGHNKTCSFSVSVYDAQPPTLTCPPDVYTSSTTATFGAATAVDNVDGTLSATCSHVSGSTFSSGSTNVTCTATDAASNVGKCWFLVNVDNTPPTISCPASATKSTDAGKNFFTNVFSYTASDNIGINSTACSPANGTQLSLGGSVVTCTVTDKVGLTGSCSFNITVVDTEKPVLACPGTQAKSTDAGLTYATVSPLPTVSVTDNVDTLTASCSNVPTGNKFPLGNTVVTCSATDSAGNSNSCSYTVVVSDTEAPVFNPSCPVSVSYNSDPSKYYTTVSWAEPVASDNVAVTSNTCTRSPGQQYNISTTTVTCTAKDAANNQVACSFNITVKDNEPPTISCPAAKVLNTDSGKSYASAVTFAPTGSDNYLTPTFACAPASGSNFTYGTTSTNCSATDTAGNQASCQFNVTVNDNQAPVLVCPSTQTKATDVAKNYATVSTLPTVTATDNVVPSGSLSVSCVTIPTSNRFPIGTTTLVCSSSDTAGNTGTCKYNITVIDTEAPGFTTCPSSQSYTNSPGKSYGIPMWAFPTATDNVGVASITCTLQPNSTYNIGTSAVTCTATDASNNQIQCKFNVTVTDSEAPQIYCPAAMTVGTDLNKNTASNVAFAPTVTDNYLTPSYVCSPATGTTFSLGTKTVVCNATDSVGNKAWCAFNVTVKDMQPPTLVCPSSISQTTDIAVSYATVSTAPATGTDNVDSAGSLNITCYGKSLQLQYYVGKTIINCTCRDSAQNLGYCTYVINVTDTEAPYYYPSCPGSMNVGTNPGKLYANVSWTMPVASDNVNISSNLCSSQPGSGYPVGRTAVTCLAKDTSNNQVSCGFNITVFDNEPPTLNCPSYVTIPTDPGVTFASNVTINVTASDNNVAVPTINCSRSISQAIFNLSETSVTCTAKDGINLTSSCFFIVNVVDKDSPNITCPSSVTSGTDPGKSYATIFTFPNVTAVDNLPAEPTVYCEGIPNDFRFYPGVSNITCYALDSSGNTANCTYKVIVSDMQAPSFSPACPVVVALSTDQGLNTAVAVWTNPTPSDNVEVASFTCTGTSGDTFPIGNSTVYCYARDTSNNNATCPIYITVSDTQPPSIVCPLSLTLPTDPGFSKATNVSYITTATDNDQTPTVNCSHPFVSNYSVGVTNVSCTAKDASGLVARCSFLVTIVDTEKPSITCPGNVAAATDLHKASANLTYGQANATDNVAVQSIVCNPPRYSLFGLGETFVTCVATDTSKLNASCSFKVNVSDTELPQVSCPSQLVLSTAAGVNYTQPVFNVTFSDNVPNSSISYIPPSGSVFYLGNNLVNTTVVDTSGNVKRCSFPLTVVDTESPNVTCPGDISFEIQPNTMPATGWPVNWTMPIITDNVGVTSTTLLVGSVTLPVSTLKYNFTRGTTNIVYTSYDAAGNQQSCTFFVQIIQFGQDDVTPPVIFNCPSPSPSNLAVITKSNDAGRDYATITWTLITATDNIGVVSSLYSSNPAGYTRGSKYPVGQTMQLTFTAMDALENKATCIFFVRASDTEPPVVMCPPDLYVLTDKAKGTVASNVSWNLQGATDNVAIKSISSSISSGVNSFPLGFTEVLYSVRDTSNNEGTCTFNVHVTAKQPDPTSASSSSSSSSMTLAGIGGGGGLVLIGLLLLFLFLRKRNKDDDDDLSTLNKKSHYEQMGDELMMRRTAEIQLAMLQQEFSHPVDIERLDPDEQFDRLYNDVTNNVFAVLADSDKEIARPHVLLGREIGSGEFGAVFEGVYITASATPQQVAIKTLKEGSTPQEKKKFLEEGAIMCNFEHENVVGLIGVVTTEEPALIVLEYMALGSLKSYLKNDSVNGKLEIVRLLKFCADVAAGMHYLTQLGYVHRDLAARNVLVDKDLTCKISDFGLTHELSEDDIGGVVKGDEKQRIPIKWCAPESVNYHQFSQASDMWSYGIVCWEIFSYGEIPYGDWPNKQVTEEIKKGYRMPQQRGCPDEVYMMMLQCWSYSPHKRPSFLEVHNTIVDAYERISGKKGGDIFAQLRRQQNRQQKMPSLPGAMDDDDDPRPALDVYDNTAQLGGNNDDDDELIDVATLDAIDETNLDDEERARLAKKKKKAEKKRRKEEALAKMAELEEQIRQLEQKQNGKLPIRHSASSLEPPEDELLEGKGFHRREQDEDDEMETADFGLQQRHKEEEAQKLKAAEEEQESRNQKRKQEEEEKAKAEAERQALEEQRRKEEEAAVEAQRRKAAEEEDFQRKKAEEAEVAAKARKEEEEERQRKKQEALKALKEMEEQRKRLEAETALKKPKVEEGNAFAALAKKKEAERRHKEEAAEKERGEAEAVKQKQEEERAKAVFQEKVNPTDAERAKQRRKEEALRALKELEEQRKALEERKKLDQAMPKDSYMSMDDEDTTTQGADDVANFSLQEDLSDEAKKLSLTKQFGTNATKDDYVDF